MDDPVIVCLSKRELVVYWHTVSTPSAVVMLRGWKRVRRVEDMVASFVRERRSASSLHFGMFKKLK